MPIYNAQILKIDAAETRRYAGLKNAEKFEERNITDACEDALLLLDVRGIWKIYDYDEKNHIVQSEPHFLIEGNSIEKHLAGCEKVACLAVTVGENIEREVTGRFRKGKYLSSMLLDAAATAAVEQAADLTEKAIFREVSREGYKMKSRYSPGYGDWSLVQQKDLYRLTGADEVGIKLTISMMLMPRKSVTAIIGLEKVCTDKKNSPDEEKSCANCNNENCMFR